MAQALLFTLSFKVPVLHKLKGLCSWVFPLLPLLFLLRCSAGFYASPLAFSLQADLGFAFLTFPHAGRMLLPANRTVLLVPQGRLAWSLGSESQKLK